MAGRGVRISLVVAVARNGVIGANGDLAWRISDDLKWFKSVTMGKPMVMGRKTFESIGKALPGRDNIVATRARDFRAERIFIARSVPEALELARGCARAAEADEVCVIGGGEIYGQTLERADRIYLTRVDAEPAGDAYFPPVDSRQWRESREGGCEKTPQNQHACEFFILDRRGR